MSNVTSLEYWNILDFIIFFVLISGTVDDHSGMSNVTCLEYFVLQNIFYTSQNLSRNSSGGPQERVPCHSFGIFYTSKYFFTLEGHTSFSILLGASTLSSMLQKRQPLTNVCSGSSRWAGLIYQRWFDTTTFFSVFK